LVNASIQVRSSLDGQLEVSVTISPGTNWSLDLPLGPEYEFNYKEVESRVDEAYQAIRNGFSKASQARGGNIPDFSAYFLEELNKKAAEIGRSLDLSHGDRNEILCRTSFMTNPTNGTSSGIINVQNIDQVSDQRTPDNVPY
jgi:hypothetical protein